MNNMAEHNSNDELEIGEITERDVPDRITRPPNNELIEYDRGDTRNEISSPTGGIGERIEVERYRLSKRFYGLYIVIAILCISTIFFYFEVKDLGNRIDSINQSLEELEKLLPRNYNGSVSLDKREYYINENATVTVYDKDRNINSKRNETVKVWVKNINTTKQISIDLTETGPDTGNFTGTFTFANKTNNTLNMIEVTINNIIEIIYEDKKTVENIPKDRIDKVIIK